MNIAENNDPARLQVSEDNSSSDSDTQFVIQYVLSVGAHGAHQF